MRERPGDGEGRRLCGDAFEAVTAQDWPLLRLAVDFTVEEEEEEEQKIDVKRGAGTAAADDEEEEVDGEDKLPAAVAAAVASCSAGSASAQHRIGALVWLCLCLAPPRAQAAARFPLFAHALHRAGQLSLAAIEEWVSAPAAASAVFLPPGSEAAEGEVQRLKESGNMRRLVEWLRAEAHSLVPPP